MGQMTCRSDIRHCLLTANQGDELTGQLRSRNISNSIYSDIFKNSFIPYSLRIMFAVFDVSMNFFFMSLYANLIYSMAARN